MTLVARRRAAVLVPWLALAAVTVFAIVQMRARHRAAQGTPAVVETAAADPVAAPRSTEDAAAALAAEAALDAALQDLDAARAEAGRLARETTQAWARADAAAALLAAHAARVQALEVEIATLRAAATAAPVDAAPAPVERQDELLPWVEDAGADDPARRRRALERAAAAGPEEVARLAEMVGGEADPVALARLAAALPAGDATDAFVLALLLAERAELDVASRVVDSLGPEPLRRPAVLEALLGRAAPGVLQAALGLLAGYEAELGDETRRAELAAALAPRLDGDETAQLHAGARAAGLLRLPGLAPRLAALLTHDEGVVRVAAAHALSRVPDLDVVRAEAAAALPRLLLDEDLAVRIAGALLAEALVGEPLDYDPSASEGARREALDAILDRLK